MEEQIAVAFGQIKTPLIKTPCLKRDADLPERMLHKNVLEPQTFQPKKETSMFKPAMAIAALMACSVPAVAATDYPSARMHTALPSEAMTVTDWYKQNVYDPNENKIGDVKDVLVDKSGKVVALIVGVGGFLGAGEKDVAVPFEAVHPTMKDKKWWLVMNTTKDSLKNAPGFKYDSNTTTWVPDRP